ncbi:MAG: diguanylate cyclase [Dissulfurispiraceae bacterium]|jgi:diguanylate cyclase (GGDEF)-like protein|nr:diguanylate cyclase [Dissulfurispiraceae bacterium]
MTGKIAFVFCANYLKEAQAAVAAENMDNAVVLTLPSRCGNPPITIEELQNLLEPLPDLTRVEIVVGALCGLQLSAQAEQQLPYPVRVNRLERCLDLVADKSLVQRLLDRGCYLTVPGWLASWALNIERMGFEQTTARQMMAETITSVVMFDTGVHDSSHEDLCKFAEYIDMPFEVVYTGISGLRLFLARLYYEWQMHQQRMNFEAELQDTIKNASINSMTIDLLSRLVLVDNVAEAIEAMMDVYSMLFAPKRLCYLNFSDGQPDRIWIRPDLGDDSEKVRIKERLSLLDRDEAVTEAGDGFIVRAGGRGAVKGVIAVEHIAFPEYVEKYLALAHSIVNICVLPVDNARKYEQLALAEKQLQSTNQKLLEISKTDALTCIANRRAYDEYIETEWKRILRENASLAIIVCDIDHFKKYNDRYGHKAGDECLITIARIISQQVTRPDDFIARYGGEEFVVVLPDTSLSGAKYVAEKIRAFVEKNCIPHEDSPSGSYVTLSLGVSHVHSPIADELSPEVFFQQADIALYKAKAQGRNQVVVQLISAG